MNPIKLSQLLAQRPELLRRMRLANLAFAYQALSDFAHRIARAGLVGRVTLRPIAPEEERYCATLTAHDLQQSVIEEHFTDEDIALLADVLGFATGHPAHELTFHLDQLAEFVEPLRQDLERSGVALDHSSSSVEQPKSQ